MNQDELKKIQDLRSKVVAGLSSLADQITDDSSVGFDALFAIAQNSDGTELLEKALKKAETIEDPDERADAYLSLLNEMDIRLEANNAQPEIADDNDSQQSEPPVPMQEDVSHVLEVEKDESTNDESGSENVVVHVG